MNTKTKNTRQLRSYRPGFLFGPLGWLVGRLSNSLAHEPDLLPLLFELEPHAMHMLGIAIALGCDKSVPATFFRQAPRAVIEQALGYWPEGIERLVQVLPAMALSPARISRSSDTPARSSDSKVSAASAGNRRVNDHWPIRPATSIASSANFQTIW